MANWPDMYFDPINLWSVWHMNSQPYKDGRQVILEALCNSPKKKQFLTKLVNDHWNYIQGVLVQDGVHPQAIERIEYHYKTAFEHGFKHAEEYHNVNTK